MLAAFLMQALQSFHIFGVSLEANYFFKLKGIEVQNLCQGPVGNTLNGTLNN